MEHIWLHGILRIPIHTLLRATQLTQQHNVVPLFIVKLLIETYSQGLYYRDNNGMIPLHHAVDRPCLDCFRVVFYNGNVEATTMQDRYGRTPLH